MDDFELLQAKYVSRVRRRAEERLRSLIHKEYIRRVGQMMRSLKGSPLSRSARMIEARRLTGFASDEVYGGELSVDAALMISTPADAGSYLSESHGVSGGTIFVSLRNLRIGESAIANSIVDARKGVKKSRRLLRAEEAAEHENAFAAHDPSAQRVDDALKQMLAKRSRRQTSNLHLLRTTESE